MDNEVVSNKNIDVSLCDTVETMSTVDLDQQCPENGKEEILDTSSPIISIEAINNYDPPDSPLDNINKNLNEFDITSTSDISDTSPKAGDLKSQDASEGFLINETESKYLEEQANMKMALEQATKESKQLQTLLMQKAEMIINLEKNRGIMEKEGVFIKRELELSVKEKENAVIRYAIVEKKLIDISNLKDTMEKKYKDAHKEIELLNGKIKMVNSEKTRVCNMLDQKCHEIRNHQKEIERLKNDLSSLEMKAKWNTLKIKQEMDLKVIAEKKIDEMKEELDRLKTNEITRIRDEADSEKAHVLEKQCMEQQATLIMLKHGNEEKEKKLEILESRLHHLQTELTDYKTKYSEVSQEKQYFSNETEIHKSEIFELQNSLDKEILKVADLQSKLNDLESTRAQLSIEKESNLRLNLELDNLKRNYEDSTNELEILRTKESELLQFNKDLTERTVKLQNEISLYNSKAVALCLENESIKKDKKSYDDKIAELEKDLVTERNQRNDERVLLTKHISEKTKLNENTQKKLDHVLGDLDAIKKKHSQTIKELNREITQLRKKCEQIDITKSISNDNSEKESIKSDLSSPHVSDTDSQNGQQIIEMPHVQVQEPSKQVLIERIVRLQQASARQVEKIDFLENHSATLVAEIQKKSKVLHYYMLRDQVGALASNKSDKNKAELAKYGGIMSAIYGGVKSNSPDMTLDLSLEINRKLQAVLEDTLLKNITLKENLDTLGLEVDKLTRKLSSSK